MKILNLQNDNLDEIVFANRNKNYGAYAIRKAYPDHFVKSMFIVFGGTALLYFSQGKPQKNTFIPISEKDSIHIVILENSLENFEIINDLSNPAAGLKEVAKPTVTDNGNYQVVSDNKVKQSIVNQRTEVPDEIEQADDNLKIDDGGKGGIGSGNKGSDGILFTETIAMNTWHTHAEIMPQFPGGWDKMTKYLQNNLRMPERGRAAAVDGKVVVAFLVDEEGNISSVKIEKSLGYGYDEAAIDAVLQMPRWIPGMQNGKKVKVLVKLPIAVKLE